MMHLTPCYTYAYYRDKKHAGRSVRTRTLWGCGTKSLPRERLLRVLALSPWWYILYFLQERIILDDTPTRVFIHTCNVCLLWIPSRASFNKVIIFDIRRNRQDERFGIRKNFERCVRDNCSHHDYCVCNRFDGLTSELFVAFRLSIIRYYCSMYAYLFW